MFWILLNEKITVYNHAVICVIVWKKISFIRLNCFRFFRATRSNRRFWNFKFLFWLRFCLLLWNILNWSNRKFIKWFFYFFNSRIFSDFFFINVLTQYFSVFCHNRSVDRNFFFQMRESIVSDFFYCCHSFSKISFWSRHFNWVTKNFIIMIQKHIAFFFVSYVFYFVHIHVMSIIFLRFNIIYFSNQKKSFNEQFF